MELNTASGPAGRGPVQKTYAGLLPNELLVVLLSVLLWLVLLAGILVHFRLL